MPVIQMVDRTYPMGELVDNGQASAVEVPPEIVESNVPSFLPLPSQIDQPRISNEVRSGGHEVHSGGHVDAGTHWWHPDSMDAHAGS